MNWKEEVAFNEKILDGLNLPEPEDYESLYNYKCKVKWMFQCLNLPPEMQGNLFNFMAEDEIAVYLQKRFGVRLVAETRYVIRRVR